MKDRERKTKWKDRKLIVVVEYSSDPKDEQAVDEAFTIIFAGYVLGTRMEIEANQDDLPA